MTDKATRIDVRTAREHLDSDPEALLVCAYDDETKFHQFHLAGAISFPEFEARARSLEKDREVIFYCA
jgi:rhodanese-related sulfurtransferase